MIRSVLSPHCVIITRAGPMARICRTRVNHLGQSARPSIFDNCRLSPDPMRSTVYHHIRLSSITWHVSIISEITAPCFRIGVIWHVDPFRLSASETPTQSNPNTVTRNGWEQHRTDDFDFFGLACFGLLHCDNAQKYEGRNGVSSGAIISVYGFNCPNPFA